MRRQTALTLSVALAGALHATASTSTTLPVEIAIGPGGTDAVPWYMVRRAPFCSVVAADSPPRVDGKLDDPVWQKAPILDQPHADNGDGPLPYATIARFARDDTYLYLAVECERPKIDPATVKKGQRDSINWGGETIELFVDTHRQDEAYVQVIFDMGGAFTDIFRGDESWNGRIDTATSVHTTGWQLEARLMIADLGGPGGKIDDDVWGANLCRSVEGMSGSWARLFGSYQQPDAFGLLTFARSNQPANNVDHVVSGLSQAFAVIPAELVSTTASRPAMHLVVREFAGSKHAMMGRLVVRTADTSQTVWQAQTRVDLQAGQSGAKRVDLPEDALQDGDYVAEWNPGGAAKRSSVSTLLVYQSDVRQRIAALRDQRGQALLKALSCPPPENARDLPIIRVKVDRLLSFVDREANGTRQFDYAIARTYRKLREIVHAVRTNGRYSADQRGWSESAIISTVDGSAQPFSLFVPPDYDPRSDQRYSLLVKLHPGGGIHGEERGHPDNSITGALVLHPLGRGRGCGFKGVPGQDVLQQIRSVLGNYHVEPDRVHVQGESMGGFGTFQVASYFPDLFASAMPICGGSTDLPVAQLVNVPMFIHHGLTDARVSPSTSIFPAARMACERCPVQLHLHAGTGHGVGQLARTVTTWDDRREIRRQSDPRCAVVAGRLPAIQRVYWLRLGSMLDPHREAYLRATFTASNHLTIDADNVEWLALSTGTRWIDPGAELAITTASGYGRTRIPVGNADTVYIRLGDQYPVATTVCPALLNDATRYVGGGPMRLFYEGRPLRIVYGTRGPSEQTTALASLAQQLRQWNAFSWAGFECGGFPVLRDTDVDAATLAGCDLILLGTPEENVLAARMMPQLPVQNDENTLTFAMVPPVSYPADEVCWSLYHRNPLAPQRRIWWFAGVYDRPQTHALSEVAELFQCDAMPDLVVARRATGQILAIGRYAKQWQLTRPTPHQPASHRWADPSACHREVAEAIRAAFNVDVSLVNPSELLASPERVAWDSLTCGEALGMVPARPAMILALRGDALRLWRERVDAYSRKPNVNWAGTSADAMDDAETYRVLVDRHSAGALTGAWHEDVIERSVSTREFRRALHAFASLGNGE